ncbi:MAG: TonB-dependent receptor, partial [Parcubacteria group bacterium Gr01-1014_2]
MEFKQLNNWEIEKDGKIYISASLLAVEFGYDRNHIGLLARQGKVRGLKINKRWFIERDSLEQHKAKIESARIPKDIIPRRRINEAPSSALSQITEIALPKPEKEQWPSRVNLWPVFKTGLRFALLGFFIFTVLSMTAALVQNDILKNSLKNLGKSFSDFGKELTQVSFPSIKFNYDNEKLLVEIDKKEFLKFGGLKNEISNVTDNFKGLSKNFGSLTFKELNSYSANLYNQFISPAVSPIQTLVSRFFGKKKETDITSTTNFEKQIQELKNQLVNAQLEILANKNLLDDQIKGILIKEPITQIGQEKRILTQKQIATIPSNLENRLLSFEQRFQTIELALNETNQRVDITPTILVPTGGGGSQGVTISNPATTDSETVKVSNLLDVAGDAKIARSLNVDSGTFYVNPTTNRVGIGTTNLETELEVAGTASISGQLLVGGSIKIGGGGSSEVHLEISGTTSTSYLIVGNSAQFANAGATVSYSRFGTNATTHTAEIDSANDLLIGGNLEIDGNIFVDGTTNFSGVASSSYFYAQPGTAASPSFAFTVDQNTGLFRPASDTIAFSTVGTERLRIDSLGRVGVGTTGPSTKFEVQGTASASYFLTGNTIQVGGFSSTAYSRFGTSTTGHSNYISASNDLLISGDLETRGTASFGGVASVSGNFFTYGTNTFATTGSSTFAGSLDITKGLRAAEADFNNILVTTSGGGITFNGGGTNTISSTGTLQINAFTLGGALTGNSQNINNLGRLGIGTTPVTTLEVQGTASASYLLTGNTLQVGGFSSAAYSRFGTATATSSEIDTTNDLLISGALEVDGNAFFDGKASISGNFQTAGRFIFGDNGDTGEINTSDWDISSAGNLSGIGSINSDGVLTVSNRAEVQGTASASYLLTGNTLQVGGFASVAYSRFGTDTTGHSNYITTTNDLLISGDLEVNATAAFDSHVAIGDATDGTDLLTINSQVRSHIIPFTNIYDVGSTANRWRKIWTDSLDVTNLTAASSSISGTVADAFTVNSDNTTSDTEDSSVTFERGSPTTNSVFKWDSTNNRFDFNFPVFLQTVVSSDTSANFTKLILKGATDQVSNDYFEIQNKDGSRLFIIESDGRIIASSSFQAGGNSVASVSYSRFGTATTGYSSDLDAANDLLISGALEVNGNTFLDGKASISGNFQTGGRFIFGDNGDTGEINTSDWDITNTGNLSGIGTIAADGAYTQTGTGAN